MFEQKDFITLLNFLSQQAFLIEHDFASTVLMQAYLNSKIPGVHDYFKEQREKGSQVHIYSRYGDYQGIMLNQEEVTSTTDTSGEASIQKGSIAKMTVDGMMMSQDPACGVGMRTHDANIRSLYSASNVNGVLVKMETGGGQSQAGDILFNSFHDRNKPVGIHTSFQASAGVKAGLGADFVIAEANSTMIGSIGTMFSINKKMLEASSEEVIDKYPETSKNKNLEFREMQKGNFEPLIQKLERVDELFMKQVEKFRPLKGDRATIKETLSGLTFDALEARRRGLIDGIGSEGYAMKRLNSHIFYT